MTNPLLKAFTFPPFHNLKAADVTPAISQLIEKNLQAIETLIDSQSIPTFDSLVMPLEDLEDTLTRSWSVVSHLNAVANSQELRQAYNECLPKLSDYSTNIGQNQRLHAAFLQIKQSPQFANLLPAQQMVITQALRDFHLSGVSLPQDKRERFAKLSQQLSELTSQFQDNVMDATDEWHCDISDQTQLAGIPEQNLQLAEQAAQKAQLKGWRLTLDFPCYFAVMTYADNRELRHTMHEAYFTRASDKWPNSKLDNSDLIEQIVTKRHELAQFLGFNNYAERSLAKKMAKSPEQVMAFLEELATKAKPYAQADFTELKNFAQHECGMTHLEPWDLAYYSEKLKQKKYAISEEELRPYFPLDTVLTGMFEVVNRLYGIQIKKGPTVDTWHQDVVFFEIYDKNNTIRGQFYVDLFARNQKRGGAWMDEAACRRLTPQGEVQLPIAYLTCNFRPPVASKPALLTHDEVLTLFHEFGHGLHHMLTKVDYAPISGINGVAWDAVELPSQLMENWCWEMDALQFISSHYETKQPLPKDLLTKMLKAKNFQSGMTLMRQLEFSLFDFRLHLEFDPKQGAGAQHIIDEIRAMYGVTPTAPYSRFQHSFNHIFSGGYAAGYYSYLWAEVLAQDVFSKFEEEGIFNPQTGLAFLEKILEKGGSEEPEILFRDFRGRDPKIEPLLHSRGLE